MKDIITAKKITTVKRERIKNIPKSEVFALRDQTAFVMTERVDGKLIVPEAVKVIQMAAE